MSISLKININSEPPTLELISKLRKEVKINEQEALYESKKQEKKYYTIFNIILLLPLIALIFSDDIAVLLFKCIILSILVFGGIIAFKFSHEDRESISRKLDYLSADIDAGICLNYEKLVKKHDELSQYQKKIAKMKRKPIFAEYDAFLIWDEGTEERVRKKLAVDAIERISSYQ